MRQDVDGTMSEAEARERGYIPTAEVPDLVGVKREVRQLAQTMRREGLRPVRVVHAYWWSIAAVEEWAAQRRWIRSPGTPAAQCSAPGCDPQAAANARTDDTFKAVSRTQRSRHASPPK